MAFNAEVVHFYWGQTTHVTWHLKNHWRNSVCHSKWRIIQFLCRTYLFFYVGGVNDNGSDVCIPPSWNALTLAHICLMHVCKLILAIYLNVMSTPNMDNFIISMFETLI
jgi:hypothetical protein